jgi:hypothetical protein
MDNESAMRVPRVRELLEKFNVALHHLAPSTGHVADPCDKDFHGADRARINQLLLERSSTAPLTGDEKMRILSDAYQGATESSIRDYFRNCGLIGDEEPSAVASRRIEDHSKRAVRNYNLYHKHQLEQYLWICYLRGRPIRDCPGRLGPWWDAIREYTHQD